MRIALSFSKLLNQLKPSEQSIGKSKLHAGSIRQRLKTQLELRESRFIGSVTRGTAIHGYSDVDLLAVFPKSAVQWGDKLISSETLVRKVRDDLAQRFPATEVRRDAQAVVIHFGGGAEPVDVVPALFQSFKTDKKVPVFVIPDGAGGWLETAPAAHANYIRAAEYRSGGKLSRTVRLIKHWRNARSPSLPLSSIYLELLLSSHDVCVGVKGYAKCVADVFALLNKNECRPLRDPVGVAGIFYATDTDAQYQTLLNAVRYAHEHAQDALEAELSKDWEEAHRQWKIVFNGDFPKGWR